MKADADDAIMTSDSNLNLFHLDTLFIVYIIDKSRYDVFICRFCFQNII